LLKPSLIAPIRKALNYCKFTIAGAIGGVAVVNTVTQVMEGVGAPDRVENYAMLAGAVILSSLAAYLHAA